MRVKPGGAGIRGTFERQSGDSHCYIDRLRSAYRVCGWRGTVAGVQQRYRCTACHARGLNPPHTHNMNGTKLSLFNPLQGRIHSTNHVAIPSIITDIATTWIAANS